MPTYNATEHRAINAAWRHLESYAQMRGRMGEVRELREILAKAKKEMGDQTDARGLLMSMLYEASQDVQASDRLAAINLAEIWQWPPYTREIKAYAWHIAKREGPLDEAWRELVDWAARAREHRINAKRRAAGLAPTELQEITS